ncbi:hypothetical protein GCM10010501_15250 [Streptomyces libani subsp. rufus]|nr:hypothetical protein GCM10010501_15250 [Streptomyces libani subsp. rufus]
MAGLPPAVRQPLSARVDAVLHRASDYLQRAQNPDGGFGHRLGDTSDVNSTAHALAAGAALEPASWTGGALAYLLTRQ